MKLTCQERGGKEFLIIECSGNTSFRGSPWTKTANMCLPENQLKALREERTGWVHNGPHIDPTYRIRDDRGELIE